MDNKGITVTKEWSASLSLILGLISIFFWEFSIFPLLALIFGIIGITKTNKVGTGRGFAITGTILGAIFLLLKIGNY